MVAAACDSRLRGLRPGLGRRGCTVAPLRPKFPVASISCERPGEHPRPARLHFSDLPSALHLRRRPLQTMITTFSRAAILACAATVSVSAQSPSNDARSSVLLRSCTFVGLSRAGDKKKNLTTSGFLTDHAVFLVF